jgi:hypothetical protein
VEEDAATLHDADSEDRAERWTRADRATVILRPSVRVKL